MKLVESKLIAKAEGLFCTSMSSLMDLFVIGSLFRKHYNLRLCGDAKFQDIDLVVYNNNVALRFDYTAAAYFSIYMDRAGNFLGMEEPAGPSKGKVDNSNPAEALVDPEKIRKRLTQLGKDIAATIEKDTFARLIQVHSHTTLSGRLDFMGARFAVYQNRPVYNLIYQGEIAFSFLMDEKGRFLDFADPKNGSADQKRDETKASNPKVSADMADLILDDSLRDDPVVISLTDDEKIETLEDGVVKVIKEGGLGESNDAEQKRAVR